MLRQHKHFLTSSHKLLDGGLILLSYTLAYKIKGLAYWGGLTPTPNYFALMLVLLVIFSFCLNAVGLYDSHRGKKLGLIFTQLGKAFLLATAIGTFLLYFLKMQDVSRLMIGFFLIAAFLLLMGSKTLIYLTLRHYRAKGYNFRNILIIGSKDRALEMIRSVTLPPESGYKILGCLDVEDTRIGKEIIDGIKVIGTLKDYHPLLLNETVDEVVFAMPLNKIANAKEYIAFAEEIGVNIRIMPDWQIQQLAITPEITSFFIEEFNGIPTIGLSTTPKKDAELFIKSAIDYIGAGISLVLLSPLCLLLGVIVKCTSAGPVFFKQKRCGVNGRTFTLYKFRTMINNAKQLQTNLADANEMDGPAFKITNDPRITPFGKFLRKTSLDELPQLINILKGEMSLVGPRPPLPSEIKEYSAWQRRRLSMKPGLTCLWQVEGRNKVSFDQWMKMDLAYIDNWSLLLDIKLIAGTFRAVFYGTGR